MYRRVVLTIDHSLAGSRERNIVIANRSSSLTSIHVFIRQRGDSSTANFDSLSHSNQHRQLVLQQLTLTALCNSSELRQLWPQQLKLTACATAVKIDSLCHSSQNRQLVQQQPTLTAWATAAKTDSQSCASQYVRGQHEGQIKRRPSQQ